MPTISRFVGAVIAMYLDCHMGPTPDITEVIVVEHGVIRVTFADGLVGELAVLSRMRGPVFDAARTPEGFRAAYVDRDSGTVAWPGGADLAPDSLYARVRAGRA